MKILFLSQTKIDLNEPGIYSDLVYSLVDKGHAVSIIYADSSAEATGYTNENSVNKVIVKTGNQFGAGIIKKGFILLSFERKFISAIKKYYKNEKFDLVLYATPPVTFAKVIKYCKKIFKCKSYLMLKDIFPQNAVDMGMLKKSGIKGIIYKYFRAKERKLYNLSDKIGCMSKANIDYLLMHNGLPENAVELFPNSVIIRNYEEPDKSILSKFNCENKTTFIFGGNLGVPQGLDFLSEAVQKCEKLNAHFFIVGKGSEKEKLKSKLQNNNNVTIIDFLPKNDYNRLCNACDVGIISLDSRFTIPNYPSRILSYMQNAMPILAVTDNVTDIKELVEREANCGKWSFNGDFNNFIDNIKWFCDNTDAAKIMGTNGLAFFEKNFDVTKHINKLEIILNGEGNV